MLWVRTSNQSSKMKDETLFPLCSSLFSVTIRIRNLVQTLQVIKEAGWSHDMRWPWKEQANIYNNIKEKLNHIPVYWASLLTNHHFPFPICGSCDFIGRTHLWMRHPTNYKYDKSRARAIFCWRFIFVPVSKSCTAVNKTKTILEQKSYYFPNKGLKWLSSCFA